MDLSKLASKEFEKDFQETLRNINKKFHLSLQCGVICYDEEQLIIPLKEGDSQNHSKE